MWIHPYHVALQMSFRIGARQVITGIDEGVVGMRKGGKRRIVIEKSKACMTRNGQMWGVSSLAAITRVSWPLCCKV